MNTLTEMGVIEHGYTLREPTDVGVQRDPINMSVAITNKYIAGDLERHTIRMALATHKYNMTKGVDYDEKFAPAPNQNTTRWMATATVLMSPKRTAWDMKLAYC